MTIPEAFIDLVQRPIVAALTTMMPDNTPQSSAVWFSYDGTHIWINSAAGRQKDKNMRARPVVSLLIIDPDNPYRYLEIRGVVQEINEEQGLNHINELSTHYRNQPDYYANNEARRGKEQRVVYKISPTHIVTRPPAK